MSELSDRIKDVIAQEPVTLFMKGTPQMIMCGNSDRALRALREAGAPVTTVDVLPDPAIRQELSALSGWPTIPQVFVGGELIGGADIAQELAESGELTRILEAKLGAGYRDEAEERVVDVLDARPAIADSVRRLDVAEPVVEVRHPLEHALVVSRAQRREQDVVRMQTRDGATATRRPSAARPRRAARVLAPRTTPAARDR